MGNIITDSLYSPAFSFFLNHQVGVTTSKGGTFIKIFSRLDGDLFFEEQGLKPYTDDFIREKCYEIHKTLNYYD